ncbi:hypothetical protein DAKH74_023150 [Maudiozyma humilis]|uniref:Major facilitator superfamily (MFS) profile domain-containing protein n=1 Tax=Maudiozyma humilis TaxID=51915 RepID=A0AAV5RZ16_MAUHU|nr:hypothetical protein DAKH74_023150 [Kazachstania humilis]
MSVTQKDQGPAGSSVSKSDSLFRDVESTGSSSNSVTPIISAPSEKEDTVPYSRFTKSQKWGLVAQCAFTGFFSSIAGAIYYPALTIIEDDFHITPEQANITIVVYFLFQGISPSIMGSMADTYGRRPIVCTSVLVYCCACVGLACAQNYSQIIGLRCLQAAGIAPVIAINSGICGDFAVKAERGGYVGYVSGFIVIGFAFGAIIGAGLTSTWTWRAIFWFLTVGSGICFISTFVFLPETKRTIVGNGSITPKSYLNKAPALALPSVRRKMHLDNPDYDSLEEPQKVKSFAVLEILKSHQILILLSVSALQYSCWTTHQAALTTALSKRYHLGVTQIGLCYLPNGICSLISMVVCGKYLNYSYRKSVSSYKTWLENERQTLLKENANDNAAVDKIINADPYYSFNICRARLQPAFVTLLLANFGYIAYGWCIETTSPLASVLVTSGFASLFSSCILTMATTLCVDVYPELSSTASGCLNLFRCVTSAIFIACLDRMIKKMNYGGVFTFMGCLSLVSSLLLLIVIKDGKRLFFESDIEL